ncbi:kinase-like domain-containing protein [Polychytrium aggregatum]|uniref:kinase-like domain-containing protein n=1 Tax=Polychytrium aggregatum TaxID=110093 RepID=UPI0022FE765E|nr:kinase-like domain-containing protein [Polychytrium aggregatum]KAI9208925.1 kinase-like domain-containing protein [Polychytrium aggregatum]
MFVATLRDISRRQNEIAWSQSRYSKEFEEMELLGRGGFGAVYRCRNRLDGQMYAIKKVELSCHPEDYQAIITMAIPRDHDAADLPRRLSNATQVSESLADEDIRIIQEVQMFARISHHPNVVRYYTSWVEAQLLDQDEVTAEDSESDESSECNSIQPSISILHKKRSIKRSNQARPPADPNKGRVRRTAAKKEKPQDAVLADAIAQGLTTQDQAPRLSDAQGTAVEIDISLSCQETGVGYRAHPSVPSSQGASPEIASGVESQTTSPTKPDRLAAATVLYIQMQLCSSSSLSKWLASRNKAGAGEIDRVTSMNIFRQIVMGLDHIHRSGFIHRDIKPANIFIETGDRVFIGDFGLAVNSSPRSSSNEELDVFLKSTDANPSSKSTQSDNKTAGVGTTLYASPEQLCGRSYDTMTDIYSLGLVFFELFFVFRDNGDRFHSLTELRHGKCPSSFKAGFPQHMSLLKKLLCEIPSRRPTTTDILAHPLLRDQESSSSRRTSEAVKSTEQRPSDVETCAACQEKDHIITRLKAEIGQLKAQLVHYEATLGIQPPAAQQQEDGSA